MRRITVRFLNIFLPLACIVALASAAHAQEGKRIALIIGNNAYGLAPLRNAVNDAHIMDRALKTAGFTTIERDNVTKAAMEEAIAEFLQKLGPDDTALFYYAGHGVQIENENFLVPVDFEAATSVIQAKFRCFSMALLLEGLKNRPKRTIIILDACRSNPVAKSQSLEAGLAQPQIALKGTYVAFSTQPGQVASDNPNGRNSWFSEALADEISQKGLEIDDIFTRVRSRVLSETEGKQVTWSTNTFIDKFFFFPTADADSSLDATLAEKWMSEARMREQREDWAEAIRLVDQVVQKKAGGILAAVASAKLPYLKARSEAQARYDASDFVAAATLDGQALQLDPFAIDAAFQAANAYLLADRLPEAARILQQIRVRGTTASLDKANLMLKQLSVVEPEAGKALEAGVPAAPPIEEVFRDTRFHVPDFDAGDRYLITTPVDLIRPGKAATAALTPPPAPPPPVPSPSLSPTQNLASLSEAELKVARAFLHVDIVPSQDTRDIAIRRIGGANGDAGPQNGFVQFEGPQTQTFVLMEGRALARQVPSRIPLAPGKYEIRTVDGLNILSRQTVEITPSTVSTLVIRNQQ